MIDSSMKDFSQLERHYHFTRDDARNLHELQPVMEKYKTELANRLYDTWLDCEETAQFLQDEEALPKRKKYLETWFIDLFNGEYDRNYVSKIRNIGRAHVKIKLDAHYMNSSMSLVRQFCLDKLEKHFQDPRERLELIRSLDKILDINLDILSSSYREEELNEVSSSHKHESILIRLAENYNHGLNLVLILALMGLSLGVVVVLGHDVWNLIAHKMDHAILHILGTLLMLWVMIELMDTEIEHLKEGKFSINIFVEVVMVAIIRDILITSLEHGELNNRILLVGTILVLGIVYWLVSRADVGKEIRKH